MPDLPDCPQSWQQFDEEDRLSSVRAARLLDTPREECFDALTRLACQLFDVPIALISLVDEQRQWFKSTAGISVRETPLSHSFCAHAMHEPDGIVIEDAQRDACFFDTPMVTGEPYIRFYAGHPIYGKNKLPLGTFCVISDTPREFSSEDRLKLERLAHLVTLEIGRRMQQMTTPSPALPDLSPHSAITDLTGRAEQYFLDDMPPRLILQEVLDTLLKLTHSEYGVLVRLSAEEGAHALDVEALSTNALSPEARDVFIHTQSHLIIDEANEGLNGRLLSSQIELFCRDELIHDAVQALLPRPLEFDSLLVIPFTTISIPCGLLALANPRQSCQAVQDRETLLPLQALGTRLIHALEKEQRIKALSASLTELHATLDVTADAILIIDEKSQRIHYANQGAADLLGQEISTLAGRNPLSIVEDSEAFDAELAKLKTESVIRTELSLLSTHAGKVPVQAVIQRIRHQQTGQVNLALVARDQRDTLKAQRKIDWISEHDALTGLLNRHGFLHLLKQQLATSKRSRNIMRPSAIMVMVMGVDRFRRINEAHGTTDGDAILAAISERLTGLLLDHPDALLARLGGDEFAVALSVPGEEEANQIMQWAQQSIDGTPFLISPLKDIERLTVTASAGLALSTPRDMGDAGELLRQANAALRRAKSNGRGHSYRYTPGMLDEESRHQHIEQRLAGAHERGDIYLHYQPIWQLNDSSAPCGAEALLRWHDAELGQIGPDVFVPILEENGDMVSLGRWILDTALDAMLSCDSRLPGHFVSVNVSAVQLMDDSDLASYVIEALKVRGLPANALEIEVTETALIQSPGRVGRQLHSLHQAGISIALDDFGTGFSSLSHLKQFPFDTVKIDRSFISGLPFSIKDRAIVESLLRLCQGFERHVCAEGIETPEQLDYLRRLGCDRSQGYALGRPAPQLGFGEVKTSSQGGDSHQSTLHKEEPAATTER